MVTRLGVVYRITIMGVNHGTHMGVLLVTALKDVRLVTQRS